ncbi:conserved hypothetical protein [delta proteobacterium NaphS2]|nr:conserved hypothetical protein [delta proteobacterium NaphS2]
MIKGAFIFRLKFWLHVLRIFGLLFVSGMIFIQIPELRYDFGPKRPVTIPDPKGLSAEKMPGTLFVSIKGTPDFERAFVYKRYGLSYTYFNIKPYGERLVVRTYEPVTDEWKNLTRFLGKLRHFDHQPFHYRIRDIYEEKFGVTIPEDAFFLALDDVPESNGWQVGAFLFACILWAVMFYMFYFYRWKRGSHQEQENQPRNTPQS